MTVFTDDTFDAWLCDDRPLTFAEFCDVQDAEFLQSLFDYRGLLEVNVNGRFVEIPYDARAHEAMYP